MQNDSDKPLGAEKHLIAGTIAGKLIIPNFALLMQCTCMMHKSDKKTKQNKNKQTN